MEVVIIRLSGVIICALLMTAVIASTWAPPDSPEGLSDDILPSAPSFLEIFTLQDLQDIQNDLERNYILMADIDASPTSDPSSSFYNGGQGWSMIGSPFSHFNGVLDGNGHIISNLYMNRTTGGQVAGIFHTLGSDSVVKDLTLQNVDMESGSLSSSLAAVSYGTVSDVHASGTVITSDKRTGGLIGAAISGTVKNSSFSGLVKGLENTGGLIGLAETVSIINCSFEGDLVLTTDNGGGMVGYVTPGKTVTIINCTSKANITGMNTLGGILGNGWGTVEGSTFEGNITGRNNIGGIAGYIYGRIQDCHSYAAIEGIVNVGGVVGRMNGEDFDDYKVTGSTFNGSVNASDSNAGGLIGYCLYVSVERSYAEGSVTVVSSNGGGLIGEGNTIKLSNSSADIVVSGSQSIGGLIGTMTSSEITRSHSDGRVNASYYGGGLVGNSISSGMVDCYACGDVNSAHSSGVSGGLIGRSSSMSGPNQITNCYFSGTLSGVGSMGAVGGYIAALTISSVFWDNETADTTIDIFHSVGTVTGSATSRDTADMMDPATFILAGWDFKDVWWMVPGITYPLLREHSMEVDAGPDQTVPRGTTVQFSSPTAAATHTWHMTYDGNDVQLTGAEPTFLFAISGVYNVILIAEDGLGGMGGDLVVINVTEPDAVSLTISTQPLVDYEFGELLDLSGMVVNISYSDDSWELVAFADMGDNHLSVDIDNGTFVNHTLQGVSVNVSYSKGSVLLWTLTDALDVSSVVVGVTVETDPLVVYVETQSLDLSGMVVNITYSNDTWNLLTLDELEANGVAVDLANGTVLSLSHDGRRVNVSADNGALYDLTSPLQVTANDVTSIVVEVQPRLVYEFEETLDLTSLVVNLTYANGSNEILAYESFDGRVTVNISNGTVLDHSFDGVRIKVEVSGGGPQALTDALRIDAAVTALDIVQQPDLTYLYGATLDLSVLIVNVTYSNGSWEHVSWSSFASNSLTVNLMNGASVTHDLQGAVITVTHSGFLVSIDSAEISVTAIVVDIAVEVQPQTSYVFGDLLDLYALVVNLTYSNGTWEHVGWEAFASNSLSVDMTNGTAVGHGLEGAFATVTFNDGVSYVSNSTATFTVDAVVTDLDIVEQPNLSYQYGSTLDLSTLVVNLTYSNGTWEHVGWEAFASNSLSVDMTNGTAVGHGLEGTFATVTYDDEVSHVSNSTSPFTVYAIIIGLTVATPPELQYDLGATLDLTSLVVNISQSNGSWQLVAFEDFETAGVVVSMANGTVMTSAHDGLNLTISVAGDVTNTTGPLEVLVCQMHGRITDHLGNPLAGVAIYLNGVLMGTTNDTGHYCFEVAPGDHVLSASLDGFSFTSMDITAVNGEMLTDLASVADLSDDADSLLPLLLAILLFSLIVILEARRRMSR